MRVLAIGSHFDDIELNCSGTFMKMQEQGAQIYLVVVTKGGKGGNPSARMKEQARVNKMMKYKEVIYLGYPDGYLAHDFDLVNKIDAITKKIKPDYIFTHTQDDFHQDHIAVAKSVRTANRFSKASLITFPSQDLKLPFHANLYVDISNYFKKKLQVILQYDSQMSKQWLNEDVIMARNVGTGIAKYVEKFNIEFLRL